MHRYKCIDYFDRWKNAEGAWEVNDIDIVEEGIYFNPDDNTDRELYTLFARIAGYKPNLRAIETEGDNDCFIEFIYTAKSVGGFFPLGRFERED